MGKKRIKKLGLLGLIAILALISCRKIHIESTKDLIAFRTSMLSVSVVNSQDGTITEITSPNRSDFFGSPFWLNESSLVFLRVSFRSGLSEPLFLFDVFEGKATYHDPGFKVHYYAARYSDSAVVVRKNSFEAYLIHINDPGKNKEFLDISRFGLKKQLNYLSISDDQSMVVFSGLDSLKFERIVPQYPHRIVAMLSDTLNDIYLYHTEKKELIQLTDTEYLDRYPTISPDGKYIAFSSNRPGNFDIYLMEIDGGNVKQLTIDSAKDVYPEFSPEGDRIAFISHRSGKSQIWIMNVDGSNLKQLTFHKNGACGPLSWSPAR